MTRLHKLLDFCKVHVADKFASMWSHNRDESCLHDELYASLESLIGPMSKSNRAVQHASTLPPVLRELFLLLSEVDNSGHTTSRFSSSREPLLTDTDRDDLRRIMHS